MKKLLSFILVLILLAPAQVFAHSKMTTSTPNNNDVLGQSPEIISMEFNTDIASLSTFTLENEQGEAIAVNDIKVDGHMLSGVPANPLETSSYTAKWTIIGADGHTVNGSFGFKVNAPEIVESPIEPTVTEQPTATPAPTTEPAPTPNTEIETNDSESSTSILVMPIIIAIIIAVAVIVVTRRTKK